MYLRIFPTIYKLSLKCLYQVFTNQSYTKEVKVNKSQLTSHIKCNQNHILHKLENKMKVNKLCREFSELPRTDGTEERSFKAYFIQQFPREFPTGIV